MTAQAERLWYLLPAGGRVIGGRARGSARVTRYLAPPDPASPALLLPLGMPAAASYGLANFTFPQGRAKRVRKAVMVSLLARGVFPPVGPLLGPFQESWSCMPP